jgi:hypothetical protein
MAVPEALDFLDATWRLTGKGRLVRPSTFTDAAGLCATGSTSEEFEARLSDLADALDRIQVSDADLPEEKRGIEGGLNRFKEAVLCLDGVDATIVGTSVHTLQRLRALRHSHQHSGKAHERPQLLGDLGIADSGLSWSAMLDVVRAKAVEALLALRTEIRRSIPEPD